VKHLLATFFGLALFAAAAPAAAETVHQMFERGNDRYWKGEYREAVDIYYEIMRLGIEDTDLWYNAATAYARMGEYGRAAYFYEKVLRVRPRDSAAQHNLDVVRSTVARELSKTRQNVDVNPRETVFGGILSWFTPNELALMFLIFYYAFFFALATRYLLRKPVGRVTSSLFVAIFLALWLATGVMLFGKYQTHFVSRSGVVLEQGIVMVHEGPDMQSPRVFDVMEAQRLEVVDASGDWVLIRDDQDRSGWLHTDQLGRL
jgi:tetratricopeptide (TPR) repeat protein